MKQILDSGQIIFYYLHSALFDDVKHLSAYMCKNIASKDGADISEQFAITDDEEDMFKVCLREALPDIYEVVKPLTHGIIGAYENDGKIPFLSPETVETGTAVPADTYKETSDPTATGAFQAIKPDGTWIYVVPCAGETAVATTAYYSCAEKDAVIIRVQDNEAYNPNDLTLVDSALQSAIEEGSLAQFYIRVVHPDLTKLSAAQSESKLGDVARKIVPLRKKTHFGF